MPKYRSNLPQLADRLFLTDGGIETTLIYSDGLASMSVFVEPNKPARAAEASSEDGATTFFVRPMGETLVSVLGEVPIATAQQAARSVARRP